MDKTKFSFNPFHHLDKNLNHSQNRLTKTDCQAGLLQPVDRLQTPVQGLASRHHELSQLLCMLICLNIFFSKIIQNYGVFDNMLTLIGHSVDGLVLSLGHVAEVGEDHKAREEAREAVDRRCDLEIIKYVF